MAEAFVGHVDELIVVGPQAEPHVELQHAVAAQQQPIATAGHDGAAEFRALEAAARDRGDDAPAIGCLAIIGRRRHLEGKGQQRFGGDLGHNSPFRVFL